LLSSFLRTYEPISTRDPEPRLEIDTSVTPEAELREAMLKLSTSGIVAATDRRAS
jgi:hypothetical protein